MRVAVIQSNYIPWKGYFDIIRNVDRFLFYDDVQFTKNDWRNRNLIKTANGTQWLTIPVGTDLNRRICDVELRDAFWAEKHWKTLEQNYRKAPHFAKYAPALRAIYLDQQWQNLSQLNQRLIRLIAHDFLGITTEFSDSREYAPTGERQDRLLDLLSQAGATYYLSGPAAKSYIQPERFAEAGITLAYQNYSGYPEYPQFHPPFAHGVTILDLLFHTGEAAGDWIWGWREAKQKAEDAQKST